MIEWLKKLYPDICEICGNEDSYSIGDHIMLCDKCRRYKEEWKLTNELRWLERSFGKEKVLQQKWSSEAGEVEWLDVPAFKEE